MLSNVVALLEFSSLNYFSISLIENLLNEKCSTFSNFCLINNMLGFKPCKSFQFKVNGKSMIWYYKHYFNCNSKDVIYILMYETCEWFYLGQTSYLKQRIRKHKSDLLHTQKSFFLEFIHFYPRIKKNCAKNERKTFHFKMDTTIECLSINC